VQRGESHIQAVDEGVAQEQYKVLVVVEVDAVVHPGAVVVHFQHAAAAHAAVVRSVRLDDLTLFAEPHRAVHCAGKKMRR